MCSARQCAPTSAAAPTRPSRVSAATMLPARAGGGVEQRRVTPRNKIDVVRRTALRPRAFVVRQRRRGRPPERVAHACRWRCGDRARLKPFWLAPRRHGVSRRGLQAAAGADAARRATQGAGAASGERGAKVPRRTAEGSAFAPCPVCGASGACGSQGARAANARSRGPASRHLPRGSCAAAHQRPPGQRRVRRAAGSACSACCSKGGCYTCGAGRRRRPRLAAAAAAVGGAAVARRRRARRAKVRAELGARGGGAAARAPAAAEQRFPRRRCRG